MIEDFKNIHLWEYDLSDIPASFAPAPLTLLLNIKEQQRYDNFKNELSRLRFLIGRYMIKKVLADYLNIEPQEITIGLSENGKPYLENNHQFQKLDFNLSHCADKIVLATYGGGKIGVDIECLDRKVNFDQISSQFFHADEYEILQSINAKNRKIHFFKLWTLKEAVVKLLDESILTSSRKLNITICQKTDTPENITVANKTINLKMINHPENHITSIAWDNMAAGDITVNWHKITLPIFSSIS
jgi:4'-phosphopantetheinyl transferase